VLQLVPAVTKDIFVWIVGATTQCELTYLLILYPFTNLTAIAAATTDTTAGTTTSINNTIVLTYLFTYLLTYYPEKK